MDLQGARFFEDGLHRPADSGAFDQRDGAKSTRPTTSIGNLEISAATLPGNALGAVLVTPNGRCIGQVVKGLEAGLPSAALVPPGRYPSSGACPGCHRARAPGGRPPRRSVGSGSLPQSGAGLCAYSMPALPKPAVISCLAGPIKPQVLTMMTPARCGLSVGRKPDCDKSWAIELESTVFLAQPSEIMWKDFGFTSYL